MKIWELVQIITITDHEDKVTGYIYVSNNKEYKGRVQIPKDKHKAFRESVIKGTITVNDWNVYKLV